MILHSWMNENVERHTLLDDLERIVELPTAFLKSKAGRLAPQSRPLYARRIRALCQYLEHHPVFGQVRVDVAVKKLSLMVIEDFYRDLEARGLSSSTVRGHEISVREFCKWLSSSHSDYTLEQNLYEGQTFLTKNPSTRLPSLTDVKSVIKLLLGMNFEEHRLVGQFIYDTGLRLSEVPRVLKSDIPDPMLFPRDTMYFPLVVSGSKGRGGQHKPRVTIISRAMASRIHKYHNSKPYLQHYRQHPRRSRNKHSDDYPAFLNTEGNPLNEDAIETFMRDASIRADMKTSSHMLRHGTAYSVLRSEHGKTMLDNLMVAQKILGHADLSTTEIYTRVPAVALVRSSVGAANDPVIFRFEEAQRIFDETYMPSHAHRRKRRGIGDAHVRNPHQ